MNFNAPHRRRGRWAGVQAVRVSFPASQRGGGGDKKPSDVTAPRSLSLGARPVAARGIGFLSHLFGLISAPSLQAEVNFMPGQRGWWRGVRGKGGLDCKLARVNGSPAEERHRGSTGSQVRGRRKDTDEPPFPVRPSGVIWGGGSQNFYTRNVSKHVFIPACFYSACAQRLSTYKRTLLGPKKKNPHLQREAAAASVWNLLALPQVLPLSWFHLKDTGVWSWTERFGSEIIPIFKCTANEQI